MRPERPAPHARGGCGGRQAALAAASRCSAAPAAMLQRNSELIPKSLLQRCTPMVPTLDSKAGMPVCCAAVGAGGRTPNGGGGEQSQREADVALPRCNPYQCCSCEGVRHRSRPLTAKRESRLLCGGRLRVAEHQAWAAELAGRCHGGAGAFRQTTSVEARNARLLTSLCATKTGAREERCARCAILGNADMNVSHANVS